METSTRVSSSTGRLGFFVLLAILLVQLLTVQVPTANGQLSFSTGWGHGKRSGASPAILSPSGHLPTDKGRDICSPRYNEIAVARIQELIQEEALRQVACWKR